MSGPSAASLELAVSWRTARLGVSVCLHFSFRASAGSADVEVTTGRSQDTHRTLTGHSQDTHRTLEITEIRASQRNEY